MHATNHGAALRGGVKMLYVRWAFLQIGELP